MRRGLGGRNVGRGAKKYVALAAIVTLVVSGCANHMPVRSAEDLAKFHRDTAGDSVTLIYHDGKVAKAREVRVADGFLQARLSDEEDVRVPVSEIRTVRQRDGGVGALLFGAAGLIAGYKVGAAWGESEIVNTNGLGNIAIQLIALGGAVVGGALGAGTGAATGTAVNHDLSEYRPEMDAPLQHDSQLIAPDGER